MPPPRENKEVFLAKGRGQLFRQFGQFLFLLLFKHIGLLKMSLINVLPLVGEVSNRKFIHALMEEKKIVVNLKNLWKRKVVIYKIVVTKFFIIETEIQNCSHSTLFKLFYKTFLPLFDIGTWKWHRYDESINWKLWFSI